jgi:hypothetical protein
MSFLSAVHPFRFHTAKTQSRLRFGPNTYLMRIVALWSKRTSPRRSGSWTVDGCDDLQLSSSGRAEIPTGDWRCHRTVVVLA